MPILLNHPWPKKKDKFTTINVLGTDYDIYLHNKKQDDAMESLDGYCSYERKYIVIDKDQPFLHQQHVLKHEIVHAALYESGLDSSTDWATNEEIVDWIAHQLYKMANISVDATKALDRHYKDLAKKESTKKEQKK